MSSAKYGPQMEPATGLRDIRQVRRRWKAANARLIMVSGLESPLALLSKMKLLATVRRVHSHTDVGIHLLSQCPGVLLDGLTEHIGLGPGFVQVVKLDVPLLHPVQGDGLGHAYISVVPGDPGTEADASTALLYKYLLNSLYGKFGQGTYGWWEAQPVVRLAHGEAITMEAIPWEAVQGEASQ